MGLAVSHDCFNAPYSAFMRWRVDVAKAAGLPPLRLMEYFYTAPGDSFSPFSLVGLIKDDMAKDQIERAIKDLPIKWECLRPSPLHHLLWHSDADGHIPPKRAGRIADALEKILPNMEGYEDDATASELANKIGRQISTYEVTIRFIKGLRKACKANEKVMFY